MPAAYTVRLLSGNPWRPRFSAGSGHSTLCGLSLQLHFWSKLSCRPSADYITAVVLLYRPVLGVDWMANEFLRRDFRPPRNHVTSAFLQEIETHVTLLSHFCLAQKSVSPSPRPTLSEYVRRSSFVPYIEANHIYNTINQAGVAAWAFETWSGQTCLH